MDRTKFYGAVRTPVFAGKLDQGQVDGMNAMLDEFAAQKIPLDQQAYMLATAFHETSGHMLPVMETRQPEESKNPSVDMAIGRLESSWKRGRLPWVKKPYWRKDAEGKSWLGRGLPQLTHKVNYLKVGKAIGVDLVANPDTALRTDIAVKIMIVGMQLGIFTGKRMDDFLDGVDDADAKDYKQFTAARVVVNGKDKAEHIAQHALKFEAALKAAGVS
jgi:hypothetical protein